MTYQRNIPEVSQEEARSLPLPTVVLGGSQISFRDVEGHPNEVYLLNWITVPEKRGQGEGTRLLRAVCRWADYTRQSLVTHPDDLRLKATMERCGFAVDAGREEWEGKPFLVRSPGKPVSAEDLPEVKVLVPVMEEEVR